MGHPERMGIRHGWSVETFVEKSAICILRLAASNRPEARYVQNMVD